MGNGVVEPRLTDYSKQILSVLPKAVMPSIAAETFKIKPALINMIERHQFGGEKGEDPNLHIQSFIQYCSTVKQKNVTPEQTMEMLFPFSLSGKEKLWINGLIRVAMKITDWDSLDLAFYFYNGLGNESRLILDSAASGRFMQLDVTRAMEFDSMQAANAQSAQHVSVAVMNSQAVNVCDSCATSGHYAQECRSSIEQCNAFQAYKQNNPYSNSYNEGYKNNPLLSYRSTNIQNPHQVQHPPPPQQPYQPRNNYNQQSSGPPRFPRQHTPHPSPQPQPT
ncbi:uncharacterized protein [Spinacia oleracea]|uniref:CCHC-type domain-containing protein n=1 Tax=Spinacia oleracea TaxID=3562 RepID=A0ABM3RJB4_SPIOL|nr:uncharacterized protein LOC130470126 [Spinacia oleracea]